MRNDLTDITMVIDRSGSMARCQKDAEGGLNIFIEEQKKQIGTAYLTLVQFDTEIDFIHRGIDIKEAPYFYLRPRGGTALLDAIGLAINSTGERLEKIPEDQRPGAVIFVIVTDGEENSSKEFQLDKIKSMITHQQDVYQWTFSFLGANQDAFKVAGGMGIALSGVATYNISNSVDTLAVAGAAVSRSRLANYQGSDSRIVYSQQEREKMVKENKRCIKK